MQAAPPLFPPSDAFSVSGSSPPDTRLDPSTQTLHFRAPFPLHHGSRLPNARVAYALTGPDEAPVVIALGGISSNRYPHESAAHDELGWWSNIIGPDRAVNTRRFRVLGIDYLGGHGDSTTGTDGLQGPDGFPSISSVDQARAIIALLDALGIDQAAAIVGASYGGMVGLALAEQQSHRVERLITISAAHRPHPLATAWRSVQRDIVRLGIANNSAAEALGLARALAMTTYRSSAEFAERFAGPPTRPEGRFRFPVERYLQQRGRDFQARFSAVAFLTLSESIDLHTVDPKRIDCPTTVVGVDSDALIPLDDCRELAVAIAAPCEFVELKSLYGHDAFLKETKAMGAIIAKGLAQRGGVA
ncbi:MAG: homoserine O-succinyltransferase [Nannocystaceae bacterium]